LPLASAVAQVYGASRYAGGDDGAAKAAQGLGFNRYTAPPRYLAPLPESRATAWLIIGPWAISPWPKFPGGMSIERQQMLDTVRACIHSLGTPLCGPCWLDAGSGTLRALPDVDESWLRARMSQYLTFRLDG
jgi:hypothetical protein